MDPITSSVAALNATFQLFLFSLELDQVPAQVRRSLDLVQTCHRDLQHLIDLRNECLAALERTPVVLRRVNDIIGSATQGLVEVCRIVEKCRPGANHGRVSLKNRVGWVLFDSKEFEAQQPVISRHHAAVLSELGFLRQIPLLGAVSQHQQQQQKKDGEGRTVEIRKETEIFDNVALLGDLMSEMALSGSRSSTRSSTFPNPPSVVPTWPFPKDIKTTEPFISHPARHSSYPMVSNPADDKPSTNRPSFELDASSMDPSFRLTTPHYDTLTHQPPMLNHGPQKFDISSISLSSPNSFTCHDQRDKWTSHAASHMPAHGVMAPPRWPSDTIPSHQAIPPSPSTLSLHSAHDASNPRLTALHAQPSGHGMMGRHNTVQGRDTRLSMLIPQAKDTRHEPGTPNSAGFMSPTNDLRHARSHSDMFSVHSVPQSSSIAAARTNENWVSPDAVHALLPSPSPSTAALDSEAPTPSLSSTVSTFESTCSPSPLSARPSITHALHDEYGRMRYRGYECPMGGHVPTLIHSQSDFTGQFGAWSPSNNNIPAMPGESMASQKQSEAPVPAMIFGSAFWGPSNIHGLEGVDPRHTNPHAHAQHGFIPGEEYGVPGSVPDFMPAAHTRSAHSQANLTHFKAHHHQPFPGPQQVQELHADPIGPKVFELP